MTFADAAKEIRERFDINFAQAKEVPVEYPNVPFTPPPSGVWARFRILWGDSFQATLGSAKRFRTPGILEVQIFESVQKGDGCSLELGDVIKTLFRSTTVNGITWRTPSLATVGRDEQWWQTNVSCPFYFDEVDNAE
jgi:hypothetical protein